MNYPLQALIKMGLMPAVNFPANSRYYGHEHAAVHNARRRSGHLPGAAFFAPARCPDFSTVATHTVRQGDRLDLLAAQYLGDPLLFWLLCDANGAIRPEQLVEIPGTILNITLPQGVPGPSNA